jgi:hypothetical protein
MISSRRRYGRLPPQVRRGLWQSAWRLRAFRLGATQLPPPHKPGGHFTWNLAWNG